MGKTRLVIGAAALAALAFLAGFVTTDQKLFPSAQLQSLKESVKGLRGQPAAPAETQIDTNHVRLKVDSVQLPGDPALEGGSIGAWRDGLIVVTGPGEFFWVREGGQSPLQIAPPPSNLDAYREAAKLPEFASLRHDFAAVRYLTLLPVEHGEASYLFLTYTEWQPEQKCYAFALARLDLSNLDPEPRKWNVAAQDWQVILRARPCLALKKENVSLEGHVSGGRMVFDAARGELIVSVGDYRYDGVYAPEMLAQDDASDYGKILRIGLDGSNLRHVAKGTRNPKGLVLTAEGELWETEHGPRGGDELNRIAEGGDYGWPLATLGARYSGLPWTFVERKGRHETDARHLGPVYAWLPSVGLSGLAQIRDFDPAWDGDLLAGSLRGQTLYRLRIVGGQVQFAETIPLNERIRHILQLPNGVIALWVDSRKVLFLTRSEASRTAVRVTNNIEAMHLSEQRTLALEATVETCSECHSLEVGVSGAAPSLGGVFEREIASTPYPGYSNALRSAGGRWTRERLIEYLRDPQRFAAGTAMPAQPQMSPETIEDLVTLLQMLNSAE